MKMALIPRWTFPGALTRTQVTLLLFCSTGVLLSCQRVSSENGAWTVDSAEEWQRARAESEGVVFADGLVRPTQRTATFRGVLRSFPVMTSATKLTFRQSDAWLNWNPTDPVGPANLQDAPVFLALGTGNYWLFGLYGNKGRPEDFASEEATLPGFEAPLKTTPWPNQFDAPGGLKDSLGGYHAWQSRDMKNWVHHGPVTEKFSRWVTTAEHVDGKTYIYYDFPNDQDPHLYIDADLTDGVPGEKIGKAFADPSDGSDCAIIRGRDGRFHLIYENWSPINARKHSWDSPLAGHAVSPDGQGNFQILDPAVDERTTPTGVFAEFTHPHWHQEDPENYPGQPDDRGRVRAVSRYEVHEPEQDAYGDWAAICIGGQYYLFGDFHPAGTSGSEEMSVAWFTSSDINKPFTFCGHIGQGHPDPDIGFAEGQFYLITQTNQDFVSPGPWVEKVEARVGVDTTKDGRINTWTPWQEVKETYQQIPGFAKQIDRIPASLDLKELPAGYGFAFEFRITDATDNESVPVIDRVTLEFR